MSVEYFTDEVIHTNQAELTAYLNGKAREGWLLLHIERSSLGRADAVWVVFERRQHSKPRSERQRLPVPDPLGTWHYSSDEELLAD